jgi:hypothetical protein
MRESVLVMANERACLISGSFAITCQGLFIGIYGTIFAIMNTQSIKQGQTS